VRDVQAFLGLTGFYQRFVEGYSKLCKGMSDLTKKLPGFKWTQANGQTERVISLVTAYLRAFAGIEGNWDE